jgi:hypothetical protein
MMTICVACRNPKSRGRGRNSYAVQIDAIFGSNLGGATAGVGLTTLQRIEQNEGIVKGNFSTVLKIQKALEQAGIHFTESTINGGSSSDGSMASLTR